MLPTNTTPDGSGTSTKVAVPSWAGGLVGALFILLGLAGVGVPDGVTEGWVLEVIGAAAFVVTGLIRLIGYYVPERNPPRSAIEVVEARSRTES